MTKEQFLDKWRFGSNPLFEADLEAVIATEIAKAKVQPALNPIEQAYERGEKIRCNYWGKDEWIKKHSKTESITECNKIYKNLEIDFDFATHPEKWELYTEPTEQPEPPMTYQEAVNLIISRKLTHKLACNDSWFACGYCGKIIQFCDERGNDMIEVRFDELDLTEWYPYKKPFDRERFEAMFRICAIIGNKDGKVPTWDSIFSATEQSLNKLDAYYASKEGGNNG